MKFAMLVTDASLPLITTLNDGVEPGRECVETPTYFLSPIGPDGHNELIPADEFIKTHYVEETVEVFVTRKV